MNQVYPRYKSSRPLPFPLEDFSFPRSGLSDLGKEKSSLGKGRWALTFSTRGYTCFQPYRTFIPFQWLYVSFSRLSIVCMLHLWSVLVFQISISWNCVVWIWNWKVLNNIFSNDFNYEGSFSNVFRVSFFLNECTENILDLSPPFMEKHLNISKTMPQPWFIITQLGKIIGVCTYVNSTVIPL